MINLYVYLSKQLGLDACALFGVRRGITSGGQDAAVTLGYPESDHQPPQVAVPGACVWSARKVTGFGSPTEPPQVRDTAADPHRNPTDETAHSGTLVMRVKLKARRTAGQQRRCA